MAAVGIATGTIVMIGVIVVAALLLIYIVSTYNTLVRARNKVKNQWAQVDVQLKKRFDLIPNLVETVKGYAAHERDTLEAVIQARNTVASASTPSESMAAEGQLGRALNRMMVLSESYPELKTNTNFTQLQHELAEIENKIAHARQFYNDTVMKYQDKREMFPTNIIASLFGFKEMEYFKAEESERKSVKVQF